MLKYSRKISSSPNGLQMYVLLKLDCPELDHSVLEQRFDRRTSTVQALLEARTWSQRSAHSTALCHIRIYREKLIIPEKTQNRLWGRDNDSCCQELPGVTADYFCFLLPWHGLCPSPGHPHRCLQNDASTALAHAVAACTSRFTKVLKIWMFKQEKEM